MPKKDKEDKVLQGLMSRYVRGTEDMDKRRTRKNGWNDIIDEYMGKFPSDWPFSARVTEPLIRTTILEKNGRLLNGKLRGRLVPREGGDTVKARVQNAVLDYQWDHADNGGSMLEKLAKTDLIARLTGAAFALTYWDPIKDCNEYKLIDPRDILIDPSADHIKNARWIQIREWTTKEKLEELGYDVPKLEQEDSRDTVYESAVKRNRGMDTRSEGELELVTEWTDKKEVKFLPKHGVVLKTRENWRKRIPVAMLRYYPLPDDIYGDSECEPVLSLSRTNKWFLSAFVEATNIDMAAPLVVPEAGVQLDTIEYTPRAIWIANDPNRIRQMTTSRAAIESFNSIYPMIKAAFGTAMGSQSLGISQIKGGQMDDKTATEVDYNAQQQNSRDQYNQLYLGEFLKDVMMMWVINNQTYLFDDPTKQTKIIRIIGKDGIKDLQRLGLAEMEVPQDVMQTVRDAAMTGQYTNEELQTQMANAEVPKYPVVMNPEEEVDNYQVEPKMTISETGDEAELRLTSEDMDGTYDYIPDVKSMAAGALVERQKAQQQAFSMATNPQVSQLLAAEGQKLKISQVLGTMLENAGFPNAQSIFEQLPTPSQSPNQLGGVGGVQEMAPPMAGSTVAPTGA